VYFLLDENVDARLSPHLRASGHDVISAVEYPGAGIPDTDVLAAALRDRRILITNDADFGELILRRGLPHAGVILLRLQTTRLAAKQVALDRVLREHGHQLREFLVVTESLVRVRRPPRG
jgi:predicted nuclease of predicted toxin-antitoxin system